MEPPAYWLPRPPSSWALEHESLFEKLHAQYVAPQQGDWADEPLPVPKWVFLCWLAEQKGYLLHGSDNADILEFEPRTPKDDSPDDFSKQTAVFATDDGIWPIFYAVVNRKQFKLRMLNGALQFATSSGEWSDVRYFFSLTESVLKQHPWHDGTVYILPRDGFKQGPPPYELRGHLVLEPHWANPKPVHPTAKLRVTPEDFPFLEQVRGHDDATVMASAAHDPYGYPWLDE